MSGYLTPREVAQLWHLPEATVRWYAWRDKWRRAQDQRHPALYLSADVEDTMTKRLDMLASANDPKPRLTANSVTP